MAVKPPSRIPRTQQTRLRALVEDVGAAEYLAAEEAVEAGVTLSGAARELFNLQLKQLRWWRDDAQALAKDVQAMRSPVDLLVLPWRHLERRSNHLLEGAVNSAEVCAQASRDLIEPAGPLWRPFGQMVRKDLAASSSRAAPSPVESPQRR